jgi:TonB family protein
MDRFKPRYKKALHETASNGSKHKVTPNHRWDETHFSGSSEGKSLRTVEIFQCLDHPERRSQAFGVSLIVHVVLLVVLIFLPLFFTDSLKLKYNVVTIAPPVPKTEPPIATTWIPLPAPRILRQPVQPLVRQPEVPVPEPPKPELVRKPDVPLPKIAQPEPPAPALTSVPHIEAPKISVATPAPPKPEIKTGVFSKAEDTAITTNAVPRNVQTGGFGDPNGLPAKNSGHPANIGTVGAFDLPAGPGAGNGTAGSSGVRGIVADSGFGAAAAPLSNRSGNPSATADRNVRQGGFEQVQAATPTVTPKKTDSGPPDKAAEIISKPRPEYTDEARKLRLEGEVLVHVLFKATGEISVLELIRGLGHGLDENALRAAQQIRFKPALRAGQPVDSTATVHILFQLAF